MEEIEKLNQFVQARDILLAERDREIKSMIDRIKEACGTSEPSAGYDWVDEIVGLLRVTRSQRDDAERRLGR